MYNKKALKNPDMKEISFNKKNTAAVPKKKAHPHAPKRQAAVKTVRPATKDPLDDLEFVDLMDDDALERLATNVDDSAVSPEKVKKEVPEASKKSSNSVLPRDGVKKTNQALKTGTHKASANRNTGTLHKKSVPPSASSGKKTDARTNRAKRGRRSFSGGRVAVALLGVLIIVLGAVVGSRILIIKERTEVSASFVGLGVGLLEQQVIGGSGIKAVDNAQRLALEEEKRIAEEQRKQEEEEALAEKDKVQVELVCQTIMGDLKIKFVNSETKYRIANVPFSVEVTGPDGKITKYTNDDLDGIIYLKPMPAGKYTIVMCDIPEGDAYKKYIKAVNTGYVAVSENINYQAVDVTDEVVSEAEAKDEQKVVNDIVEETVLQDTVAFVESTKTPVAGTEAYIEVTRDMIKLPSGLQAGGGNTDSIVLLGARRTDTKSEDDNSESNEEKSESGEASSGEEENVETGASNEPEKNYTAEVLSYPTEIAVGEAKEIKITTNLQSPSFNGIVTDGTGKVSFSAAQLTGTEAVINIVGEKEGKVSIQVHVSGKKDDGSNYPTIPTAVCVINVKAGEINDTQKITTKDNQTVYVKDASGNYIEATYGDYQAKKALYVRNTEKVDYLYTGWQSIDGATYYYTADGKKVTGEQVIRGVKYSFNSDGVLQTGNTVMGIDVSAHNGVIDWAAVKSAGVQFAIIRVGFRGYETGRLVEDSMFRQNLKGAISNGIRVGVYVFSAAVNEVEAVEEASLAINLIKGYNISYPVYIDIESSGTGKGRADKLSVATRTAIAHAFCKTIAASGYKAGVYSSTSWYNNYLDAPQLTGYSIWLAQYNTTVTYKRTKYDIWQYTSKGTIPGIKTSVDMNIGYTTY